MPYIFFKIKNCLNDDLFISCDDRIGKMLHNICISAVAMSLRWATYGPWASGLFLTVIIHWFHVRSVSQTVWNIFKIFSWNVEQDQTTCHVQEWQLICFCYFLTVIIHWFRVRSVSQRPFGIYLWYLVEMQNRTRWCLIYKNDNSAFLTFGVISLCYVWQWLSIDFVSKNDNSAFLTLALSPFMFDSDYPLILCPLCKSKTLWNIFMILCRNVEQDQMMCCIQEWQLCLSYFWCCLLIWVLRPFQEYFTYIEPIVHRRWAKTGEPGEKPPDYP